MEQFIAFFGSRPFKPQLFSERKSMGTRVLILDLDLKPLPIVRSSLSLPVSFVHFSPVGIMRKCSRLKNICLHLGPAAQCTNTSNKRVLRLCIFFPSSILIITPNIHFPNYTFLDNQNPTHCSFLD